MSSIVQLIISILDTIKAWITRKNEKAEKQAEKVSKANESLKDATHNGDLADLYSAAKDLQKAHKE